ncbi:unnamed protein product, partial [marine sediment metagenome]
MYTKERIFGKPDELFFIAQIQTIPHFFGKPALKTPQHALYKSFAFAWRDMGNFQDNKGHIIHLDKHPFSNLCRVDHFASTRNVLTSSLSK